MRRMRPRRFSIPLGSTTTTQWPGATAPARRTPSSRTTNGPSDVASFASHTCASLIVFLSLQGLLRSLTGWSQAVALPRALRLVGQGHLDEPRLESGHQVRLTEILAVREPQGLLKFGA